MPEIHIPAAVITGLQVILAFTGAFTIALWVSLIIWTFKDVRARSRDVFAILLATLMVVIFGPLGLLLYFLLRPNTTLAEQYERALEEEALLQDLEDRPRCPGCSRQVKEEWILCPDCHTTLKKICPECGETLELAWTMCPYCATHVGDLSRPAVDGHEPAEEPPAPAVPEPEPATVASRPAPGKHDTQPLPVASPTDPTIATPPVAGGAETRPQQPPAEE
ncbi:MAG: zinc ribbon domain-containing protein [Chloroflexi bacterium]|nr:MAG: zinc ribbon domain-containing protein [Chloroflexota bacterium]